MFSKISKPPSPQEVCRTLISPGWKGPYKYVGRRPNQLTSGTDTYPGRHFMDVSSSMMIVEHNYGEYDGRCHHEHDAVKVSSWKRETTPILVTFVHVQYQTSTDIFSWNITIYGEGQTLFRLRYQCRTRLFRLKSSSVYNIFLSICARGIFETENLNIGWLWKWFIKEKVVRKPWALLEIQTKVPLS